MFQTCPITFNFTELDDKEYEQFVEMFKSIEKINNSVDTEEEKKNLQYPKNIWIIKPGENTNKGRGIIVCDKLSEINSNI